MHRTSTLMAGVTAAMLVTAPGAATSEAQERSGAGASNQPAPGQGVTPDVQEVEDRIMLLLDRTPRDSAKSLDELMPHLPDVSRELAEQAMALLLSEDVIHRVGDGTAESPYRYWSLKGHGA